MINIRILFSLVGMHFKKFYREPAVLFWAVAFPIVMSWLLGIAFDKKQMPPHRIIVTNQLISAQIYSLSLRSPLPEIRFSPALVVHSESEAQLAMKQGEASIYLTSSTQGNWIYHFDAKNAEGFQTFLALEFLRSNPQSSPVSIDRVSAIGGRYIDFLIPGLMAMGILSSCLWGLGWALIDFRMKKMLRRLMATPIRRTTFLLSHLVTRLLLTGFETLFLYGFAHFYFHVNWPAHGLAFLALFVSGTLAFTGIAILMSSRTSSPVVGNGLLNAVLMPMLFLSGIFFSYHNYPAWLVSVVKWLPLTLLADGLRATMIESATLAHVLPNCLALVGFGIITFGIGLRMFKWS